MTEPWLGVRMCYSPAPCLCAWSAKEGWPLLLKDSDRNNSIAAGSGLIYIDDVSIGHPPSSKGPDKDEPQDGS